MSGASDARTAPRTRRARLLVLGAISLFSAESPAAADTFTVTTADDRHRGTCSADCSLREAVIAANEHAGPDTVAFSLSGSRVIQLTGAPAGDPFDPNPVISTGPITVDGTTQPGYAGRPLVTVRGTGGGTGTGGGQATLSVQGGGTVRGLAFGGAPDRECLQVAGGTTVIEANHIGVDAAGTTADPCGWGLRAYTSPTGTTKVTAVDNLISGNRYGFYGFEGSTTPIVANFQRNRIGTDVTGTAPLPNVDGVITMYIRSALIGGPAPADGNLIAFNQGVGVALGPGTGVLGNRIFANGGGNTVSANGGGIAWNPQLLLAAWPVPPDPDEINGIQNSPTITSVARRAGGAQVTGTLVSRPNTAYRVEFFGNSACGANGFGQGERFLGAQSVTTDGGGQATFDVSVPLGANEHITATATGASTSPFSACGEADLSVSQQLAPGSPSPGGAMAWQVTVTNLGPAAASVSLITVTDTFPTGVQGTGGNPRCTPATLVITCGLVPPDVPTSYERLAPRATRTVNVYGRIAGPGPHTNTVRVQSYGQVDTNPANNTSTLITTGGPVLTSRPRPAAPAARPLITLRRLSGSVRYRARRSARWRPLRTRVSRTGPLYVQAARGRVEVTLRGARATFSGGPFVVHASRPQASLQRGSERICRRRPHAVLRRLRTEARQQWKVDAPGGTAFAANARWTTQARCDGTFVRVQRGRVTARGRSLGTARVLRTGRQVRLSRR